MDMNEQPDVCRKAIEGFGLIAKYLGEKYSGNDVLHVAATSYSKKEDNRSKRLLHPHHEIIIKRLGAIRLEAAKFLYLALTVGGISKSKNIETELQIEFNNYAYELLGYSAGLLMAAEIRSKSSTNGAISRAKRFKEEKQRIVDLWRKTCDPEQSASASAEQLIGIGSLSFRTIQETISRERAQCAPQTVQDT